MFALRPALAAFLLTVVLACLPVGVTAQPAGDLRSDERPIDEIVITERSFFVGDGSTATKTDTPLVETPQSVSVINSDLIDAWNAGKLTEAMRYVPGVQAEPFGIEPRFTNLRIRGFDAATTGIFRDGLVLSNPGFAVSYNLEPYGAEKIEIPRGPVSVLYGRGSPGGLLNYISKRPARAPVRELEVEIGNFERYQGQFDFSGPIDAGNQFLYRLTGVVRNSGTQIDFVEEDRIYVAPALTWSPSDDTRLTLLGSYQQDDTKNSQALPEPGTLAANPNGSVPINRFTGEPDVDEVDRTEYAIGYAFEHRFSDGITLRQNARYNYVDLNDTVIFSNGIEPDLRTINRGAFGNFGELDGFSIDSSLLFDLGQGNVRHTLLAGIDYQAIDVRSTQSFGGAPPIDIFDPVYGAPIVLPAPFRDDATDQDQLGIYVQDQIRFFEHVEITLGLRYDNAQTVVESRLFDTTTETDDDELTYRAAVSFISDAGIVPYFSYATSFLPNSATDANGNAFAPESGRQYEVGVKYEPAPGQSLLSVALFDLQREDIVEFDPATFLPVQRGTGRSRGLEIEFVANLDFGLDVFANYSYLDTEIRENANPAIVGNRFTQIPEQIVSVWGDYRIRRGPLAGLGIGLGVRHQSANFGDAANTIEVPAYTLGDLAIYYQWQKLRFAVNMQNVADEEYAATCFVRSGANFCTFGEARTIRGTVNYRW